MNESPSIAAWLTEVLRGVLPASATESARHVDLLFLALMAASLLIVLLLGGLIGVFAIRYRRGNRPPRTSRPPAAARIEILGTGALIVIFSGFFGWGATLYLRMSTPPDDAMEIYVIARQWMWEARHPDGRREHNTLHVPSDVPVKLIMASEDVIHSFYVPAFRQKQDVLPGKYVTLWFEASEPGSYDLYCAEYCGMNHSLMTGRVVVLPPEEFARWRRDGRADDTLAGRGRRLFDAHGCAGCHAPGSLVHAPNLDGLFGRNVPMREGGFVKADEAYLRDAILLPQKHAPAGYEPVMPTYEGVFDESELLALVEYLKSLAPRPANEPRGEGGATRDNPGVVPEPTR